MAQLSRLPVVEPIRVQDWKGRFSEGTWIFEEKYDGFRGLYFLEEEREPRFISKAGRELLRFKWLRRRLAEAIPARNAILDGEIVAFDQHGRATLSNLLRLPPDKRPEPVYIAFDLLWLDDEDLRMLPLSERKDRLKKLIPRRSPVVAVAKYRKDRLKLFQAMLDNDREGMVAKRIEDSYTPDTVWYRLKNRDYSDLFWRRAFFNRKRGE